MSALGDLLEDIVEGVDAAFLFSPTPTYYERFTSLEDVPVVVVAPDNSVDADQFVELPVDFEDVRERVRFGLEGGLDQGFIEEGAVVVCATKLFDDAIDTITRVNASEFTRSGVYSLFVNSRAEPGVIRDVLDVTIELGKKGQKGKQVGALFVVGDAGKVMNKSRSLSYNPFEKSHVHVGDPIVNVMLKEFSLSLIHI